MANFGEAGKATSLLSLCSTKCITTALAFITAVILLALYLVDTPLPGLSYKSSNALFTNCSKNLTAAGRPVFAEFRPVLDRAAADFMNELVSQDGNCTDFDQTLSIITPVGRVISEDELLQTVRSIKFYCITRWILVYDTTVLHDHKPLLRGHDKIVQLYYHFDLGASQAGHAQRNRALAEIPEGLVYNLDDDNIVHPHFWDILPQLAAGFVTTFDQQRSKTEVLPGSTPATAAIDTASFVIDKSLIGQIEFNWTQYDADGMFVEEVLAQHPGKHIYIPEIASYYNFHKQSFDLPV